MQRPKKLLLVLIWAFLACELAAAPPEKAAHKAVKRDDSFLRLRRSDDGDPLALETSIVSYVDEGHQLTVDLVGAVHVGEKQYYAELNELFTSYDVLLYELVAPKDAKPDSRQGGVNAISAMQRGLQGVLELEYQLDRIDYKKPNFVHADLTPESFAKKMDERGESFAQMFFRMLGQSIAVQSRDPARSNDALLLAALFSRERAKELKRVLALQFEDAIAQTAALDGPDGSTIITERNKEALRVLDEQIKKDKKRIGIFYGAAHLPDMEERLLKDFGLKRSGIKWLVAWNLADKAAKDKAE